MCGIVGYSGNKNCIGFLIDGLKKLEYRGYDSAGVAVETGDGSFRVIKKEGRISVLEENLGDISGYCGIGHTRWATHGKPSDNNSHPHACGKFALVHNGIIENFLELKIDLVNEGAVFNSQTDSEVVAQLLNRYYDGDFLKTVARVTKKLRGSYAFAIICSDFPGQIVVARKDNPLLVGLGDGENFLASDALALAAYTDKVHILEDGEFGIVTADSVTLYSHELEVVNRPPRTLSIDPASIGLLGFESYMIKEIKEIPEAIKRTFDYYLTKGLDKEFIKAMGAANKIDIVACGTAYHAGILGKYIIEKLARIPVEVDVASEYRYKDPIIDERTLLIAISQSGETADTLAAVKLAKSRGAKVACIANVPTSSLVRISDFYLPTLAGPEIAVAATKSYNTQLCVLYVVALFAARDIKGVDISQYMRHIVELPEMARQTIEKSAELKSLSGSLYKINTVFFLGRGADYAVALEGALKLKEISYIQCQGYPAGELKHGPLALIDINSLVVILNTQSELAEKTLNALHEVKARDANVIHITQLENKNFANAADITVQLPRTHELFMPILSVIPLQIFSYYMSRARGNDPDKPRNLAKSVTVE